MVAEVQEPTAKRRRTETGTKAVLEVVVVGCGVPKFSMGWVHLFQLLRPPFTSRVEVVGVVEDYFLSDAGKDAPGAELFRGFASAHPEIAFVASCSDLPPVSEGRRRVGFVCVRTPGARQAFEDAVLSASCQAVYLEKPGAGNSADLEAMIKLADERHIPVMVGYMRNFGEHARRAREHVAALLKATQSEPPVTLLHMNPFADDQLPEVFRRCRPGQLYDQACHDLAFAVAFYGARADTLCDVEVDPAGSLQATYDGIEDFVRLKFSFRPAPGKSPLHFDINRQGGMTVGILVDGERFIIGDRPLQYHNPMKGIAPHHAPSWDVYIDSKLVFLSAIAGAAAAGQDTTIPLPRGALTLPMALEVMRIADKLTDQLRKVVPR